MALTPEQLIQISQARNPSRIRELSDIISGGIDTFQNAKNQRLELHRKLIEQQMLEEKRAADKKAAEENAAIRQRFLGTGNPGTPADPKARLEGVYDEPEVTINSDGGTTLKFTRHDAAGSGVRFTPEQVDAINSRDPKKLAAAFPTGIPKEALGYTYSADRIANLEAERGRLDDERDFKRRERRSTERTRILDRFNADSSVKKAQTAIESADMITELVNSGNPIAAGAIPTYMARASGEVGALSEADKAPFGGSQALMERLEAAITQKAQGVLTPDNRKFLGDLASIMRKRGQENIKALAQKRSKQYGRASDFLDEKEIYSTLYADDEENPEETPEQRKARLLSELQGAR